MLAVELPVAAVAGAGEGLQADGAFHAAFVPGALVDAQEEAVGDGGVAAGAHLPHLGVGTWAEGRRRREKELGSAPGRMFRAGVSGFWEGATLSLAQLFACTITYWFGCFFKKKKHHVVLVSAAEHAQEGEKGGSAWSSALKMKAEVGPVKAAAKLLLRKQRKGFLSGDFQGNRAPGIARAGRGEHAQWNRGANVEQIHAGGGGAANLAPGQRTAPGVNFAHFHPALGAELLKRGKAAEIWDIIFFFSFPSALSTCKSMAALQRLRHDSFKVEE